MDGAGTAGLIRATGSDGGRTDDRDLDRRLRAAGLRATAARRSVLAVLTEMGGHRTADEVFTAVRADGRPIARASAFNALRDLVASGLVLVVDVPGAARYEPAGPSHHHFVCRACGAISDVEPAAGPEPYVTPDVPGARVEEATVVFRGLCAVCATSRSRRRY